jgi:hypothetical protein
MTSWKEDKVDYDLNPDYPNPFPSQEEFMARPHGTFPPSYAQVLEQDVESNNILLPSKHSPLGSSPSLLYSTSTLRTHESTQVGHLSFSTGKNKFQNVWQPYSPAQLPHATTVNQSPVSTPTQDKKVPHRHMPSKCIKEKRGEGGIGSRKRHCNGRNLWLFWENPRWHI